MSKPFSKLLTMYLEQAERDAATRGHAVVTCDHMMLQICADEQIFGLIEKCKASASNFLVLLADVLDKMPPVDSAPKVPPRDAELQRVLSRAHNQGNQRDKTEIECVDFLISMYGKVECRSIVILETEMNVSRYDIVNALKHGVVGESPAPRRAMAMADGQPAAATPVPSGKKALEAYCEDLNDKARSGTPLIGREKEVDRVEEILGRMKKSNPMLVGEPGVGKTAVAEGLARRIVEKAVPAWLLPYRVLALDLSKMLAGTRYRGDFEERMTAVLAEVTAPGNRYILFIDEIHSLIGAGDSKGDMDASNMLKPALASSALKCIGATTFKEFRRHIEPDGPLSRRFQKVEVKEPTKTEALRMLTGVIVHYTAHHGVTYTAEALEAAVRLSVRHIPGRKLPDKALDVIDEAGSYVRGCRPGGEVGVADIERAVTGIAKVPAGSVNLNDRELLRNLPGALKAGVFGQDSAIMKLAGAVKASRAGLRDPEKPVGNYLFSGPTGVGKTEVARQLASALGIDFLRFDMSEYMEKHAVSRLIGAPPGYVGFDQGGLLTDAVSQTPHCVLLLDEAEKAHPDLMPILLQVMDHGKLTDGSGQAVDFRNVLLILTTNAGAEDMAKENIGFGRGARSGEDTKALERMFSPEFRNRLDAIVPFEALKPETMLLVVDKFLSILEVQLEEKNVSFEASLKARMHLATRGYDRANGARPLGRLIGDAIKVPLADELLFGKLEAGGTVYLDEREGELTIDCEPLPTASRPAEPRVLAAN